MSILCCTSACAVHQTESQYYRYPIVPCCGPNKIHTLPSGFNVTVLQLLLQAKQKADITAAPHQPATGLARYLHFHQISMYLSFSFCCRIRQILAFIAFILDLLWCWKNLPISIMTYLAYTMATALALRTRRRQGLT